MNHTCITSKPRVAQPLVKDILRRIESGDLSAGQMIGTEVGMARQYGISRVSIRRAFDELEAQRIIQRRPGKGVFVGRSSATTRTVQVIVSSLPDLMSSQIVRGAQRFGLNHGIHTYAFDAESSLKRDLEAMENLASQPFDGAIIVSLHHPRFMERLWQLKLKGYPFVVVDQHPEYMDVSSVAPNFYKTAYLAGKELIRRGHSRIGFVGPLPVTHVHIEGLRDALNDAGLPFDRRLVARLEITSLLDDNSSRIEQSIRELLSGTDLPSALYFCRNSDAAIGYKVIQELGLRIPQDISVVAREYYSSVCENLVPKLTSLDPGFQQVGEIAMQLLIQRLNHPDSPPERIDVDPVWVERLSVADRQNSR